MELPINISDADLTVKPTNGDPGMVSNSVDKFVSDYLPVAQRIGGDLGVDPSLLLGQWGLETGWGKSIIPGTNNLGNIKDFSGSGPKATDNMTGSRDSYRKYASADEFGDDFAGLMSRRYRGVVDTGADPKAYFGALKSAGYAQDPAYVAKGENAARMARQSLAGLGFAEAPTQSSSEHFGQVDYGGGVKNGQGNFMRSLGNYVPQMKEMGNAIETLSGVGAKKIGFDTIGDALIEDGLKGLGKAKEQIQSKDTDSFSDAWEKGIGAVVQDWLPYQVGQAVGNMGESLLAAGAGTLLGGAAGASAGPAGAAAGGATGFMAGLLGKSLLKHGVIDAAKKIAEEKGEDVAKAFLRKEAGKLVGQNAAVATMAAYHGLGETGSRVVEEATKAGLPLQDIDMGRYLASAAGHAALEFIGDKIALGGVFGEDAYKAAGKGVIPFAKTVAGNVLKVGVKESPVEIGQTAMERTAAGLDLTSEDAQREYLDAGTAALAMGVAGAPGGVRAYLAPDIHPTVVAAEDPGNTLSKAAVAGNPDLKAQQDQLRDPITQRVNEIERQVQEGNLLDALRNPADPNAAQEFVYALNIAKNPSVDPLMRKQAMDAVERFMQSATNPQNWVPGQPDAPGTALVPTQNGAMTTPGSTSFFDPNTIDGDVTRVDNMIGGPKALPPPGQGSTKLSTQPAPAGFFTPETEKPSEPQAPQAQQTIQEEPQAPAAVEKSAPPALKSVPMPTHVRAAAESDTNPGTAQQRKVKATLLHMVRSGFDALERRDNGFFMVNYRTNEEVQLENAGQYQMARNLRNQDFRAAADQSPNSPTNNKTPATPAQIAATNYHKPVVKRMGQDMRMESPKGSTRSGTDPSGKAWSQVMANDYGEISRTEAADGDPVDAFVGDGDRLFVVDQVNKDGTYDEPKVMLGFRDEADARQAYLANYEKGWTGLGAITEMTVPEFNAWKRSPESKLPIDKSIPMRENTQTSGDKNGQDTGAIGRGVGSQQAGAETPAGTGTASDGVDSAVGGVQAQVLGDGAAGDQLPSPQHVPGAGDDAGRGVRQNSRDTRAHDLAAIQRLATHEASVGHHNNITPADPSAPEVRALNALLSVFESFTGIRGVAIHDDGTDAFDGVLHNGTFFVNVDNPMQNVASTIAHEFKHFSDRYPGLKAFYDRMWDLIPEHARRRYFEAYKFKGQSYDHATAAQMETLKDEMLADFMGKRFTDKQWLSDLGRQKPQVFGSFIKDWVRLLNDLINKFKSLVGKNGGTGHFIKDIDALMRGYITQLEEMKSIAMEVAEAWAKERPGYAERTGVSESIDEVRNSSRLEKWASDFVNRDKSISHVEDVSKYPSISLKMAGMESGDKIVARTSLLRHLENRNRSVDPALIGKLPMLLAAPRATIVSYESGYGKTSFTPMDGYKKRIDVISSANDSNDWPILIGMSKEKAGLEIVDIKTVFGQNNSLAFVLRAIQSGGFVWMPGKEVGRIKAVIGQASIASASPEEGAGPRSAKVQSNQRPTGGIVFSDEATVKAMSGAPWQHLGEPMDVTDAHIKAAHGVKFSARSLQAELDAELGQKPSDVQIKEHGIRAEDAYAPITWANQTSDGAQLRAMVPNQARDGQLSNVFMTEVDKGLWEVSLANTWVGATDADNTGYMSRKGVQAFVNRYAAGQDLARRGFDLASTLDRGQKLSLVQSWQDLNRVDGVRRLLRANSMSLKDIVNDMGINDAYDVEINRMQMDDGGTSTSLTFANKKTGDVQEASFGTWKEHGRRVLAINSSALTRGGLGSVVYQMLSEYAAVNNMQIVPETSLSGINTYRRTEQMLSAALRTGKSNVMVPHATQRVYGFEDRAAGQDQHNNNIARLLLASLRNVREIVPEIDSLLYHPETGVFTHQDGSLASREVGRILRSNDARAMGIGKATLARASLTRQMLDGSLGKVESFAEPVLYSAREDAQREFELTRAKYEGTEEWLKAPNGQPTRLTETQWVTVRTPRFLSWFGDWTKGNVWDRDDVSKVVDENGEPMVVYHGTDEGGFMAFRTPGGEKRGDLGIFTTSNESMARSYVRKGRLQDLTPRPDQDLMEEDGFDFDSRMGRLSSKQAEPAPVFFYSTPGGDEVSGFASMEDAVADAVAQFGLPEQDSKAGIYAVFVNLRNPSEASFEGALWSGERVGQWEVYDKDGDTAYTKDGRAFMSQDEAQSLADEIGGTFEPASDHYETTDSVARDGRKYGHDGSIIREVIDDGGGPGYDGEPSDVFIANSPNQIKSAEWNTGEFGETDDVRYNLRGLKQDVADALPGIVKVAKSLTETERAKLRKDTGEKMLAIYKALPSSDETAAVAFAGKAKRGWYRHSVAAIQHIFGADGWRFVGLLAATSPQCSVESNLLNALNTWKNWTAAGRPTDRASIVAIMGRSVQGVKGEDSVLNAWINNSVSVLSAKNFGELVLSGPKVDSFMRNLNGNYVEVTNDAWIANYALVDQILFSGNVNKAHTEPGKGPGYLAMNAKTREAAKKLGWEPAEVQETVWSWAMSMLETMDRQDESRGAIALLEDGAMTDELINRTPDFGSLFHAPQYSSILEDAGYSEQLKTLTPFVHGDDTTVAPFSAEKMHKLLTGAGLRLEFLQRQRRTNVQLSWEARPGESTGVLSGVHSAPVELQQQYMADIFSAITQEGFYDKTGLSLRNTLFGPGAWQGKVLPGAQSITRPGIVADNKGGLMVDPESRKKITVAASVLGLVLNQEGVYWHYPIYKGDNIPGANGIEINYGRSLTNDEMSKLYAAIIKVAGHDQWAPANTSIGVRVLNFSDTPHPEFHRIIKKALKIASKQIEPDNEWRLFQSDGDAIENNWLENKDGQEYISRISKAGRSDLLGWVNGSLQAAITEVNQRYTQQHGWGAATREEAARKSARVPGQRAGGDQGHGSEIRGAVHYGKQPGLSTLAGRMSGTGIKGAEQARLAEPNVDPRIKQRVYFYLPLEGGIPQAEIGLGGHVYQADIGNLYDPLKSNERLPTSPNAFEKAVLDAGYDGYINPEQGTAVVLGRDVPVSYQGPASNFKQIQRRIERIVPKLVTRVEGNELVRKVDNVISLKAKQAAQEAAPSFRLEHGEARVARDQSRAADEALAGAGSAFQFGRYSTREVQDLFDAMGGKGLAKKRAMEAVAKHPLSKNIQLVQSNYHDILIDLMDKHGLTINGFNTLTEENASCL